MAKSKKAKLIKKLSKLELHRCYSHTTGNGSDVYDVYYDRQEVEILVKKAEAIINGS